MSSSSSGSSSESSSSPAPTRKRRQVEVESLESSDDHDTSDAPQPLPPVTEDTVFSHAERRRQKKKQKQKQLVGVSPRKKRKLDDGTITGVSPPSNIHAKAEITTNAKSTSAAMPAADDPTRQKRQNSVWVGNLSFRTTQDALRGYFDGAGTITRVHMPMRRGKQMQGENMGFAYVDFETPEAKTIAITLSEGHLDGRNLLIKDGLRGGEGREPVKNVMMADGKSLSKTAQKILRTQKQPPAPTLFLGNLGFETTEGSIRELFEAHRYWAHRDKGKGVDVKMEERDQGDGEGAKSKDVWIRKIRMGTFEDSGACKGFAFVDFTSIEHATEALLNPRNHRLNGRDLVVEYASPDAVRRGGGGSLRNPKGDRDRKGKNEGGSGRASQKGSTNVPYTKQRRPRHIEQEDDVDGTDVLETSAEVTTTPSGRLDRAGHDRSRKGRARPGAALAHAQRQSAAILPSQGQKITF
ncbi:hypothetical protein J3R83DRAFT_1197 [Lanmaoa asiatica]|nr:hypothetical protein J3R83DRAFT_1197 [Lanmaoa asiatica]